MTTTPWFGGNPYYEDEERITFTDAEMDYMLDDPSFGYVCASGHSQHRWNNNHNWDGTCWTCEAENEAAYYEWEAEEYEKFCEAFTREAEDIEAREAEDRLLRNLGLT